MASKKAPAGSASRGPQDTNSDAAKLDQHFHSRRTCPHCGGPVSTALLTPDPEAQSRGVAAIPARPTSCILMPDGSETRCGRWYRVTVARRAVDDALEARRQGDCSRTAWLDPADDLWSAIGDSWLLALAELHGPAVVEQFNSIAVVEIEQQLHLRLWTRGPELLPIAEPVLQDLAALLRCSPISTVQAARVTEAGTTVLAAAEVQR